MALRPEMGRTLTWLARASWRSSGMVSRVSRAAASRAPGNRQSAGSSVSLKKYRPYRSLSSGSRASGGSMFSDGIITMVRADSFSCAAMRRSASSTLMGLLVPAGRPLALVMAWMVMLPAPFRCSGW